MRAEVIGRAAEHLEGSEVVPANLDSQIQPPRLLLPGEGMPRARALPEEGRTKKGLLEATALQEGQIAGDFVIGDHAPILIPFNLLVLYEAVEDMVTQGLTQ